MTDTIKVRSEWAMKVGHLVVTLALTAGVLSTRLMIKDELDEIKKEFVTSQAFTDYKDYRERDKLEVLKRLDQIASEHARRLEKIESNIEKILERTKP